jgi:hypothetical protein
VRLAVGVAALIMLAPGAEAARQKPGPINAEVRVDQGRTAGATITQAAGGKIVVTARDGTKVTITFPAGAVLDDTAVTATPVTELASRYTRRGLLAGVQLEPEGLQLVRPAKVRFARRGKAPKGTGMVFVGSLGDGADLYRLPPPTRIRGKGTKAVVVPVEGSVVPIDHFSTVEAFDWSTAKVAELDAINRPALGLHQLSQDIAELLAEKPAPDPKKLAKMMERHRQRFIVPLIEAALNGLKSSCSTKSIARARSALQTALAFDRQAQLLGTAIERSDGNAAPLMAEVGRCMSTLCTQLADPRITTYLLSLSRQLRLLGAGYNAAFFDALYENAINCGVYEIRLDSRIDWAGPQGYDYSMRVKGTAKVVPLTQTPPRGPVEYVSTSGSATQECVVTTISGTKNGEFVVQQADLGAFDPDSPSNDRVVRVTINLSVIPMETYTGTLTGAPNCPTEQPASIDQPLWFFGFQSHHLGFTFPASEWLPDNAPVFASAIYPGRVIPVGDLSITENTKLEIVHTPDPPVPVPDPL